MTFPLVWKKRVDAKNNGDFISIETYSGFRLPLPDPEVTEYLLEPNVSDEILGQAVVDALKQSRFLPYEEACAMEVGHKQRYMDWIQKLMNQYGYKTKRALFKNMKNCDVICYEGIITIEPTHHEKLEAWSGNGIKKEDYVKVPADAPPAEVGAGLRLAFSRCTG